MPYTLPLPSLRLDPVSRFQNVPQASGPCPRTNYKSGYASAHSVNSEIGKSLHPHGMSPTSSPQKPQPPISQFTHSQSSMRPSATPYSPTTDQDVPRLGSRPSNPSSTFASSSPPHRSPPLIGHRVTYAAPQPSLSHAHPPHMVHSSPPFGFHHHPGSIHTRELLLNTPHYPIRRMGLAPPPRRRPFIFLTLSALPICWPHGKRQLLPQVRCSILHLIPRQAPIPPWDIRHRHPLLILPLHLCLRPPSMGHITLPRIIHRPMAALPNRKFRGHGGIFRRGVPQQ